MSIKQKIRLWINQYRLHALHKELDELSDYLNVSAHRLLELKRDKNRLQNNIRKLGDHGRA